MTEPITSAQVWSFIWQGLAAVAKGVGVVATLGGALAFLFLDDVTRFMDERVSEALEPFKEETRALALEQRQELAELQMTMDRVSDRVGATQPFIEILSIGVVRDPLRTYRPGDTVSIEYLLQRHLPCATDVEIRWFSRERNRVLTNFTTVIPATRANPSFNPIPFTVDLRVPDLPSGGYSYRPLLRPDTQECPGQQSLEAPFSMFFEVVND